MSQIVKFRDRYLYKFRLIRSVAIEDQLPHISCETCEVKGRVWARDVDQARTYCKAMARIPGLWLIELSKGDQQLEPLQIRVDIEILSGKD